MDRTVGVLGPQQGIDFQMFNLMAGVALRSRPMHFSVIDVFVLLGLNAVALYGVLEIHRALPVHRAPARSSVASKDNESNEISKQKLDRDVTVLSRLRFNPFWFRQFVAWVVACSMAIWLSFFATAYLMTNENWRIRSVKPRLTAAFVCLLCLSLLALTAYQTDPHWYRVDGNWVNAPVSAGMRAVGLATAATCLTVCIELVGVQKWGKRNRG